MNDDNNNKDYFLSLKDLFSEILLRDLVLFMFLFLLIISQIWDNMVLLLFPLISFIFSLFFRMINTNKWRTEFENSWILYSPLGLEKKHANRLFFSTVFQLILIFWIGAESLYNPHLITDYFPYFTGIFVFSFTFGFSWIFIDLWKNARIEVIFQGTEHKKPHCTEHQTSMDINNVISFLKVQYYTWISIANFLVFVLFNVINIIFIILLNLNIVSGMELNLPGTGSEGSEPIIIPHFILATLITSPVLTIIFLTFIYKSINNFSNEKLNQILESLPKSLQIKIIENLKAMNNKIKKQLKFE